MTVFADTWVDAAEFGVLCICLAAIVIAAIIKDWKP